METIWSHISVAVAGGLSLYSFATEYLRQSCHILYCQHPTVTSTSARLLLHPLVFLAAMKNKESGE